MKKFLIALALATALFSSDAFAQASGGHALSAATNNSTLVTTGNGGLWDFQGVNTTATVYYVRFYDTAVAPNCASATGVIANFPVPASTTGNGLSPSFPKGKLYSSGLGFCITAGSADNDNVAAATGVTINFDYGR